MRSPEPSLKGLPRAGHVAILVVALLAAWAMFVALTAEPAPVDLRIQQINSLGVPDELVPDITPGLSAELESLFGLPGADGTSAGSFLHPGFPSGSLGSVPGSGPAVPTAAGPSGQSVTSGGNVVPNVFEQAEPESASGEDGKADGPGEDGNRSDGSSTVSGAGGSGDDGDSEDDGKDGDDDDDDDDKDKEKKDKDDDD